MSLPRKTIYETTNNKFNPNTAEDSLFSGNWANIEQEIKVQSGSSLNLVFIEGDNPYKTFNINFPIKFKSTPQVFVFRRNAPTLRYVWPDNITSSGFRFNGQFSSRIGANYGFDWIAFGVLVNNNRLRWRKENE